MEALTLTVIVLFVPDGQIHEYCSKPATACYKPALNTVYVREPRGFYDRERLLDLGHEIFHAIGNRH